MSQDQDSRLRSKCDPPGVQRDGAEFSACLYAGPYFECELGWDASSLDSAQCITMECGGSPNAVKLVATAEYCAIDNALELELKVCVDVLSDFIAEIGSYISAIETFMNNSFGVYEGCLRLAWANYDISRQRLETTASRSKHLPGNPLVKGQISGKCK